MPAISVIMPVYNAATTLREALDSVLAQTYRDFSLIVVDDGSTDSSREIVESYQDSRVVHLLNKRNQGIEFSLNRGISAAIEQLNRQAISKLDCQYLFRMDSDDICFPQRFAMQLEYMQANPSVWVLGSWVEMLHENGSSSLGCMPLGNDNIRARMLFHAPLIHPSCVVRREVFEKIKYSSKFPAAEDYDLWCKLALNPQASFDCMPKALLKYRLSGQSVSVSRREIQRNSTRKVREQFLQRLGFANPNNPNALDVHNIWADQDCNTHFTEECVKKIEDWGFYLLAKNEQNNYCSPQALQLEVGRRYFSIAQSIRATQPDLASKIEDSPLMPVDVDHAKYF